MLPDHFLAEPVSGRPTGYFVQAHDGFGRLMYDERGYPVLVNADHQKAGLNATRGIRVLVAVQLALVIAGLIIGIVGAVELHHLVTYSTSTTSIFGP